MCSQKTNSCMYFQVKPDSEAEKLGLTAGDQVRTLLIDCLSLFMAYFVMQYVCTVCIRKFITREFLQPKQSGVRAHRPYQKDVFALKCDSSTVMVLVVLLYM